ncbi:aldo-keto reductase family 1 member B1-like [Liolophura sinensis]|uniref:aldo-keto reductase family 1 member B1-like n=1 Tax=Liolophura sinensis TaxID=3198878 RepID=UPI0031596C2C
MSSVPTVCLSGGQQMPMIGFGTWSVWQDPDDVVSQSVKTALEIGYRHIDCAFVYNNEEAVGRALKEKLNDGSLKREDLFVTTKLWDTYHGTERPKIGLQKSLDWLGLDYVDLYLIHWPFAFKAGDINFPKDENGDIILDTTTRLEDTWKGMEACYDAGLAKNLGISNFNRQQTEKMLGIARIKPCSMQAELNVYHSNPALVEHCQANGLHVTAFAPLGAANRPWKAETDPCLFDDPVIKKIAAEKKQDNGTGIIGSTYNNSVVCLRYLIQLGITVIPKSSKPQRIKENFEIFDFSLTEEEMTQLKSLNRNLRVYNEGIAKAHPEWPFHVQY